jgi:hypothetical protein
LDPNAPGYVLRPFASIISGILARRGQYIARAG